MSKSYSNLYPQVIKEINKRAGKELIKTDSRYSVQPSGEGGSIDARALAEIITTITSDLADLIEPRIISGLDVSATTPPSDSITITSGSGTSDGKLWELSDDITLTIPFDTSTYVFYVVLYNNALEIARSHDDTKCEICKIVVPKPGVTSAIVDDKPTDGYHAWIVSAKDVVYDEDQEFDDASVEKLRDVIGRTLADNLIGNINLSEYLKITNTQGSLEIDSSSIKILSNNDTVLAKFNRDGTFFYNDSGVEIAKFSIDEARIGNILITESSIQSGNFVSGHLGSGFQILDSGDAEFNNILARGKLTASVFEKDTISAIGGSLLVMDADILDEDMTNLDSSNLTISGDTTFTVGDILRIKDGIDDEWLEVTAIDANTYAVTRNKANVYSSNNNPIWKKGTSVVNFGQSGEGGVYMTSSESNAPYLSIVSHAGSPWSALTTHLRLGNLNGFLDYLTDEYGIAIGTSEAYLKYDATNGLQIKGIVTLLSGSDVGDSNQLLDNGNFEVWSAGDAVAPDGWTLVGAGATIAKEASIVELGTYSAKLTRVGTDCQINQDISAEKGINYWKNRKVTIGCWVYATVADRASIQLVDNITTPPYDYHTGVAGWEFLTVSGTIADTAPFVKCALVIDTGDTSAYFDGAMCVEGSVAMPFAEKNYSHQWISSSDSTLIDGGSIYANSITVSKLDTNIFGSGQLLDNGNFEDWSVGTNSAPDGWTLDGTGAAVGREIVIYKIGSFSAAITYGSAESYLAQQIHATKGIDYWKGKTVTFGCWVYCATASCARIWISDGVTITSSSFHTGGSAWEWLTVTKIISATAVVVQPSATTQASGVGYFDGAMCVEGSYAMPYADKIRNWGHPSDYTKIDGGDIYTGTVTANKITTATLAAITADLGAITAGTVTGATIQTAASGARVLLNTSNLTAYDDAATEIFKILISGADVGDVIIGSSNSYVKWDKSATSLIFQSKPISPVSNEKIIMKDNTIKIYDESGNERVILGVIA